MTNFASRPWENGLSNPQRLALRGGEDVWTYGRLREAVAEFAGALRGQGLGPGQRAVLIAPTVPEFAVAYYGMLAAGATVVGMNPLATTYEIDYVIEDAECALLVAWHDCAEAGAAAAGARGVPFWQLGPGGSGVPAATPIEQPYDAAGEETAVILYTSGTTGNPKGAELTHANLVACGEAYGNAFELSPDDVYGTALPLFHVFGGSVILGTAMMKGAAVELLPRFDAADALRLISSGRLTLFMGVPTMFNAMLQEPFEGADFSSLRFCFTGGAPLPDQVLHSFEERFGIGILEGYGLTETTAAGAFNGLHRVRKPGSVGIALPGMEVRVVDSDGRELGADDIGEVVLRGPQVMKGYYGRPEATAEAIRDGWFHSGDLGSKDADGDLRIVDRKKDMIIRGGYNVYPREIEQVLYVHPDVVEAAVLGREDEHLGEEIVAVLALRAGAEEDPQALYRWTKERISAYKVPRLFQFVESLPKGTTSKILKREIVLGDLRDGRPERV